MATQKQALRGKVQVSIKQRKHIVNSKGLINSGEITFFSVFDEKSASICMRRMMAAKA